MSHAPAAYDGMCINCGMSANQQIAYAHCSTGAVPDISFDEWYDQQPSGSEDEPIACQCKCHKQAARSRSLCVPCAGG